MNGSKARRASTSIPQKLAWGTVVLAAVTMGGCTVADAPMPDATLGNVSGDAPTVGATPPVRLPSIRLSRRSPVAINALTVDRQEDAVVVVATVTQRAALLEGWLYQLQDDTGSVWVLTERSEPQVGERVTVEGLVRYEPITVGDIEASDVYLEETVYQVGAE